MKMAVKIRLSIFIVALICAGAISICFYFLARNNLEQEIRANLASTMFSRVHHVKTYLGMLKISVGQLSKNIVLENYLKAATSENFRQIEEFEPAMVRLRRTKEANPSLFDFFLMDKTGRIIASSAEENIGEDKAADVIFTGARNETRIKDAYFSEKLKAPVIAVSTPVTDSHTGRFLGVLAARVKLNELNAICTERTGLGKTGEIYIVNKDGFMITPSLFLKDTFLKQKVDTENVRRARRHTGRECALPEDDRMAVFPDYRGVMVLGTHEYLPEMQWIFLAEMDTQEAFAPLNAILRIFVIILSAFLFIAWIFGSFLSRSMTKALVKLHKGTEIIGSGNLDYKIGIDAADEIGRFARAFDTMTANLKTTTTSVENLNKEISARTQMEEDLSITLRSIGDALIATDTEGKITRMNPVAEKLTGWPLAEAAGKPLETVFRLINARTREPVQNPFAQVMTGGQVVGLANHTALIARGGTEYQIADSAAPIRNPAGQIRGVVLVFHDVTTEYQVKEALRKKSEELEGFFNIALDLLCIADLEGNFIKVNKAWEDILGYPAAELEQRKFLEFVHPDDMQATLDAMARLGEGKSVLNFTNRYRHKDGNYRFIEWRSSPHGNLIYAAARDITERKRGEDELRKLSQVVEQSPAIVVITDLLGNIEYVNPKFTRVTGYGLAEVLGKNPHILKSGELSAKTYKQLWETITSGREWRGEFHNKKKDGTLYWESALIAPVMDAHGRIDHFLAVKEDITERKLSEKTLDEKNRQLHEAYEQAKKLAVEAQSASAAKGQFVANISHEIRTPLNGIIGVCELLLGTRMTAEQQEYAQIINASAETLLNIINATLDFSKIDAGKMELEHINFNLRNIFEDIIGLLAVNAGKKKLELIGFIEPSAPLNLNGDPGRLRQILFNLIGNAIKFTSEGEIVVTAALVEDKEECSGSGALNTKHHPAVFLRFTVRDTGIGIPSDKTNLIFNAFTQVDDSFTRKFGGTGLGLAISKKLVEQMGGRIGLESAPGKGSTFWFVVPFIKQQPEITKSFEPDAYFGGQRILVVDDNETNRTILAMQLQSWGVAVDMTESGKQALEKLRSADEQGREPFLAVITDQRMPEMDGLTLAKMIKADPDFQDIALILMTSVVLPPELYEAHKHFFAGIILKPVRQSHLYYSLLTALSGEKPENNKTEIKENALEDIISPIGLRILVAEDNATNQKVICSILAKMGHWTTAVANGKEVLQALELVPYDLVLMDIQMPEMDGFETTTIIRNPGTPVIDHNIPILALTAHAMEGDREKCLKAGMNGYIPKPITTKSLANAVTDIIASRGIKTIAREKNLPKETGPVVFDEQSFAGRLMNDRELMGETIRIFLEDMPKRISELAQMVKERDCESARQIAHTIKGSSANVSGQKLQAAAARIETLCETADWRGVEELILNLNRQFEMLARAMREFLNENSDCRR